MGPYCMNLQGIHWFSYRVLAADPSSKPPITAAMQTSHLAGRNIPRDVTPAKMEGLDISESILGSENLCIPLGQ